jgi:hypothetical protein
MPFKAIGQHISLLDALIAQAKSLEAFPVISSRIKQDKDLSELSISEIFGVAPACEETEMEQAASLTTWFEETIALY